MSVGNEVTAQYIAMIAGVGGGVIMILKLCFDLLGFEIKSIQQIRQKKLELKLKNLDVRDLDLMNHPFWNNLYIYLENQLPYFPATSEFKKRAATAYIKVTWINYEKLFKSEIAPLKLHHMTKDQLYKAFVMGYKKLNELKILELKKLGMDDKIILTFEKKRVNRMELIMSLYKTLIDSDAYSSNVQRIWAILDFQNYMLEEMGNDTWTAIMSANGELKGLSFDGYENPER